MKKYQRIICMLIITLSLMLTMSFQVTANNTSGTIYNVGTGGITFEEALSQVQDGDTIKLISDTAVTTECGITKNITINSNGYKLDVNVPGKLFDTLIIYSDVVWIGNGYYESAITRTSGQMLVEDTGKLSLKNIFVDDLSINNVGVLNVYNAVLTGSYHDFIIYDIAVASIGTINIEGNVKMSGLAEYDEGITNIADGATLVCGNNNLSDANKAKLKLIFPSSFALKNSEVQYTGKDITVGEQNTDIGYINNGDPTLSTINIKWYEFDVDATDNKGNQINSSVRNSGKYVLELSAEKTELFAAATNTFTVEIKPKDLTVTVKDQTINYGGFISSDISNITVEGLLDGHKVSSYQMSQSTSAVTNNGKIIVDSIEIKDADGNVVTDNYDIKFVGGKLTIIGANTTSTKAVETSDSLSIEFITYSLLISGLGIYFINKKSKQART